MIIIPASLHTDFQLIALSGFFLIIKIDRVILTQVGFCVISP